MLVNSRPIRMASGRDVNQRLDRFAAESITSSDAWADVLAATRDWMDYSARNQLLLASYGASGPVAGLETWRLVPSTSGRTCAVRAGEHGLPVRVPITTAGSEPDPHVGRARPTSTTVDRWEWRPVFCLDQLARRPEPGFLDRDATPVGVSAADGDDRFLAASRAVAARTVRGRLPKSDSAPEVLAQAARRLPRAGQRPALDPNLAGQVAWLVASSVGESRRQLPPFDPEKLAPRDRWETLLDVLDPARRLTAALGSHLGVDLLASPLPRMEIDDDRVIPAGRRNRLPRATVAQLPVGEWVEVGPYTTDEWTARGADGTGKGAYLRLSSTAYVIAVEQADSAVWHVEDTRAKAGAGILADGDSESLDDAKATAVATLRDRFPQLAEDTPARLATPADPAKSWEPLPGRPDDPARRRHLDGEVTLYVLAMGERWLPMVQRGDGPMEALPDTASRAEAMNAAELSGRRAAREQRIDTRVEFDDTVASLAHHPSYTRDQLATLVGVRLEPAERAALRGDPAPAELIELLGAAGVTPATTVAVLRAEGLDAPTVAGLLPMVGVPTVDAIRVLHEGWDVSRVVAGEMLNASASEMRSAGCSATEIMQARSREVLSVLPADPQLWELAAGTMAVAGHPAQDIAAHLATHASNADCFASGIAAAVDDPGHAIALAVRYGMPTDALVACSERYGLSPAATATALGDAGASVPNAVQTLFCRCDGDPVLTTQVARSVMQLRTEAIVAVLETDPAVDADVVVDLRSAPLLSRDRQAWLAAQLPHSSRIQPGAAERDLAPLLASLPDPVGDASESDELARELPAPAPAVHATDTSPIDESQLVEIEP